MAGTRHLWLFIVSGLLLNITPGPDSLFIMARSATQGWRAGFVACWGIGSGVFVHVFAAALGLSALLATSATAFTVVKVIGAAYLVWIGIAQWRASDQPLVAAVDAPVRTRRELVVRGWAINATNPKGTVFMLAVVPNFIDLSHPLIPQYGVIMMSLSFTDLVVMAGYVALAARVLRALDEPHHVRLMNRCFGGLFVVAGTLLASFRRAT